MPAHQPPATPCTIRVPSAGWILGLHLIAGCNWIPDPGTLDQGPETTTTETADTATDELPSADAEAPARLEHSVAPQVHPPQRTRPLRPGEAEQRSSLHPGVPAPCGDLVTTRRDRPGCLTVGEPGA